MAALSPLSAIEDLIQSNNQPLEPAVQSSVRTKTWPWLAGGVKCEVVCECELSPVPVVVTRQGEEEEGYTRCVQCR